MSKKDVALWMIPVGFWCVYASWHYGYQLGYADGHTTAWNRYQSDLPFAIASETEGWENQDSSKTVLR